MYSALTRIFKRNPEDVQSWYALAGCFDFIGEEKKAEPCYRRCFEIGLQHLPEQEQKSFFVGYGSTLRNNLKYDESVSLLTKAVQIFPDSPSLKLFLALSHYSKRNDTEAAETLFLTCLDLASKGFDGYEQAIQWYIEHLKNYPEGRNSFQIVSYNNEWPLWYKEIFLKLKKCIGKFVISIDHIGSTSIPGLASKNRIDVQVTVKKIDEECKREIDQALTSDGFQASRWNEDHRPAGDESSSAEWKKLFVSGEHSELNFCFNIHFRAHGVANQIYPILFRDYLRAFKDAALAYQRVKEELARFHRNDSYVYSELKDPVCDLIMVNARRWAKETDWKLSLNGIS